MERDKRVIYAPVRTSKGTATTATDLESTRRRNKLEDTTDLKYLDSDSEEEGPLSSDAQHERAFQQLALNKTDHSQVTSWPNQEQQQQTEVEEVYLCECCGVTQPLEPAMEFVPVFRSLFTLFNLLALLFGLAAVGLGLWFRIDPKVYELHFHIETQNFSLAGWLLLASGLIACLLTASACLASKSSSICLLSSYALIMGLLSALSIGTLVLLTVFGLGDSLERFLAKEMMEQLRRRTAGAELEQPASASQAAQFVDFVQVKLRCCGAQGFRDYQKLGMVVPTTCYTIATNFINAPGCGEALRELLDLRAGLAAGAALASSLAQLLAALLASLMACSIYHHRAQARPRLSARNGESPTQLERPVELQRPISSYPIRGIEV